MPPVHGLLGSFRWEGRVGKLGPTEPGREPNAGGGLAPTATKPPTGLRSPWLLTDLSPQVGQA